MNSPIYFKIKVIKVIENPKRFGLRKLMQFYDIFGEKSVVVVNHSNIVRNSGCIKPQAKHCVYIVAGSRGVCLRTESIQHDATAAAAHGNRREKGNKRNFRR